MQVLNIFHVLIAIALVAFVLIQKGTGATAGAAFGSGASGTVFGARGAGNFLTRSTWVLATLFCTISLTMAVLISRVTTVPENDLGVVGSALVAPTAEEMAEGGGVSVTSDEPLATDVPTFDAVGEGVPVPEASVTTEEAEPVKDGETSSESGGGDS